MTATIALLYGNRLHVGGVETHLLSLLRHGDRARYRRVIVAATSAEFAARVRAIGAQVVPWEPAHNLDLPALTHLRRLLRAQGVHLVHMHSPRAATFGRLAARALRLPAVVTVHIPAYYGVVGTGPRARLKRLAYLRLDALLNRRFTDRLIYVSARVRREAGALGLTPAGRTLVVENGIALPAPVGDAERAAVRTALGAPADAPVLCCVGRLDGQKGIDVLLDALGHLQPRYPALRTWVAGDGADRAALEQQARRLGLESAVQLLGFRDDVPALLGAADVFVLPSRFEAMSIAVLEAMAAGLPVVATDVGDNARLLERSGAGSVVPVEDPAALAAALARLLADPALRRRMGQAARQRAAAYDETRMVQGTEAVYRSLLG